jgi:hypothetical protein
MTFRQYIHLLAESIGLHQIPVRGDAKEIRSFLAEDAIHHHLVKSLIRDIYRKNSCGHLDARIDRTKTMNVLGNMRAALLAEDNADICKVGLMNQLCEVSCLILGENKQQHAKPMPSNKKLPALAKI